MRRPRHTWIRHLPLGISVTARVSDDEFEDFDEEADDESASPTAEASYGDFPPEEEDQDNPDLYREPERGNPDERLVDEPIDLHGISDAWNDNADAVIDSDDEYALPSLSVTPLSPPPTNLSLYYDATGYYAYVLAKRLPIPFGEDDAEHLIAALRQIRATVTKSARSHQAAADGIQYDWYIRVAGPDGLALPEAKVRNALSEFERTVSPELAPPDELLAQERAKLKVANATIARLLHSHQDTTTRANDLENELREAQEELARLRRDKDDSDNLLTTVLNQFGDVTNESGRPVTLVTKLRSLIDDWEAQRQRAILTASENAHFIAAFDPENTKLRGMVHNLEAELERVRHDLAARTEENRELKDRIPSDGRAVARKHPMEAIVEALVPTIALMRGSLDVIFKQQYNPIPVLQLVGILHSNRRLPKAKQVRCDRRWREVHYSDGQDNQGRLYYLPRDSKADTIRVLISSKDQQKQDWEYLKRV